MGRIIDPLGSNIANTIARVLQPWCLKTKKSNQAKMLVGFFLVFTHLAIVSVVESEGFEPSSKRVLLQLSTCVVFV